MMQDGILLIDKPSEMTSFGVVARVRRVLSEQNGKKTKVGHCGTLDPFATGLLILCVGSECKHAGEYMKHDKVYEATFRLGQTSTTGDPEGEITDTTPQNQPSRGLTLKEVERVLREFIGEIKQTPPVYSAIKVGGRRAYDLARAGKEVEIPERTVTIHSLDIIDYDYPELKIRTHVSSGTYIRSLAQDIGKALGTGAYCSQLRRTHIADWSVENAQKLQELGIGD